MPADNARRGRRDLRPPLPWLPRRKAAQSNRTAVRAPADRAASAPAGTRTGEGQFLPLPPIGSPAGMGSAGAGTVFSIRDCHRRTSAATSR